jgi:hypothetical protein
MNFDWYGASVDAGPDETLAEAVRAFDMASLDSIRATTGFNRAMALKRGDTTLATIMWENLGDPTSDACFVQGTGRHAAPVAQWLRTWQPMHRVARADVAEDYRGDGTWEQLSGLMFKVADEYHVKTEHAGDWHRGEDGRSVYVGGRQSVVRAIGYEKGKQLGSDPTHVRVELRVRPGSRDSKYKASQLLPSQFYGASRWSAALATALGNPEVQRLSLGTVYRDEDVDRSRRALLRQYGTILCGISAECGGWSAAGEWIGAQLLKDK